VVAQIEKLIGRGWDEPRRARGCERCAAQDIDLASGRSKDPERHTARQQIRSEGSVSIDVILDGWHSNARFVVRGSTTRVSGSMNGADSGRPLAAPARRSNFKSPTSLQRCLWKPRRPATHFPAWSSEYSGECTMPDGADKRDDGFGSELRKRQSPELARRERRRSLWAGVLGLVRS
jgi:hypothetical protein